MVTPVPPWLRGAKPKRATRRSPRDDPPHPLAHHAGAHAVNDAKVRLLRQHRRIHRGDRGLLRLVAGHAAEVDLERRQQSAHARPWSGPWRALPFERTPSARRERRECGRLDAPSSSRPTATTACRRRAARAPRPCRRSAAAPGRPATIARRLRATAADLLLPLELARPAPGCPPPPSAAPRAPRRRQPPRGPRRGPPPPAAAPPAGTAAPAAARPARRPSPAACSSASRAAWLSSCAASRACSASRLEPPRCVQRAPASAAASRSRSSTAASSASRLRSASGTRASASARISRLDAEPPRDGQAVGAAGHALQEAVGRRERRGVELERGVHHARRVARQVLERAQVRGRERERARGAVSDASIAAGERRALGRIGAAPDLVEQHQRARRRPRPGCGAACATCALKVERLAAMDWRSPMSAKKPPNDRQPAAGADRRHDPALRQRGGEPDRLEQHGLAAGVRAR